MELARELAAVVGLDHFDSERQTSPLACPGPPDSAVLKVIVAGPPPAGRRFSSPLGSGSKCAAVVCCPRERVAGVGKGRPLMNSYDNLTQSPSEVSWYAGGAGAWSGAAEIAPGRQLSDLNGSAA
jgi:hypothetical protein